MNRNFCVLACVLCVFCSLSIQGAILGVEHENDIVVCEHSAETVLWLEELVSHASQSIEMSPCFFGGPLLHRIMDMLEKRMQTMRGLKVHLLCSTMMLEPSDKKRLEAMRNRYSRQFHLNYTSSVISYQGDILVTDNHVKMCVVDEKYYIFGGTNFDECLCTDGVTPVDQPIKDCIIGSKLPKGARDQDVVGRGALAKDLRVLFYQLIAFWDTVEKTGLPPEKGPLGVSPTRYQPISQTQEQAYIAKFEESEKIHPLASGDMHLFFGYPEVAHNPITELYTRSIDEAKEEIWIGNLHFAPVKSIHEALKRAVRRGVKVHVITNGVYPQAPSSNKHICYPNSRHYVPLMYGKDFSIFDRSQCKRSPVYDVHIYEYRVPYVLYHKKVMIVDGKTLLIGSYNLALRSDASDHEIVVQIRSPEACDDVKKILEDDITRSKKISAKQAQDWYFDPLIAYTAEVQRKLNQFY